MTINILDVHAAFSGQAERYPKILYRIVKREGIPTFIITNNGKVYDTKYNQIKIVVNNLTGSTYFNIDGAKFYLANETVAAFKLIPEVVSENHSELPMSISNIAHILSGIGVPEAYKNRQFKNNTQLIEDAANMLLYTKYNNSTIALALGMNNSPVGQLKQGNIYSEVTGFTKDTFYSERNIATFKLVLEEVSFFDVEKLKRIAYIDKAPSIVNSNKKIPKNKEATKVPSKKTKVALEEATTVFPEEKKPEPKKVATVKEVINHFNRDPHEMQNYLDCMSLAQDLLDRGFKLP